MMFITIVQTAELVVYLIDVGPREKMAGAL